MQPSRSSCSGRTKGIEKTKVQCILKRMAHTLSTKQRRMAELMAEGHTAIFAYEQAGYSGDPAKCAFKIQENSGFKRYLSELQAESRAGAIMTRTKRLERLSAIASGKDGGTPSESTRAIAEMNKMEGSYASEKVGHDYDDEFMEIVKAAQHKSKERSS